MWRDPSCFQGSFFFLYRIGSRCAVTQVTDQSLTGTRSPGMHLRPPFPGDGPVVPPSPHPVAIVEAKELTQSICVKSR